MRIAKSNAILTAVCVEKAIIVEEHGTTYTIAYFGDYLAFDDEGNFKGVVSQKDVVDKWEVLD